MTRRTLFAARRSSTSACGACAASHAGCAGRRGRPGAAADRAVATPAAGDHAMPSPPSPASLLFALESGVVTGCCRFAARWHRLHVPAWCWRWRCLGDRARRRRARGCATRRARRRLLASPPCRWSAPVPCCRSRPASGFALFAQPWRRARRDGLPGLRAQVVADRGAGRCRRGLPALCSRNCWHCSRACRDEGSAATSARLRLNTAGAVAGALASGFGLIPLFGASLAPGGRRRCCWWAPACCVPPTLRRAPRARLPRAADGRGVATAAPGPGPVWRHWDRHGPPADRARRGAPTLREGRCATPAARWSLRVGSREAALGVVGGDVACSSCSTARRQQLVDGSTQVMVGLIGGLPGAEALRW